MKIQAAFLRSKVGRRLLGLFLLCVLLPTTALTLLSFRAVRQELRKQSETRLRQETKERGMALLERLDLLDAELQAVAIQLQPGRRGRASAERVRLSEGLARRFTGVSVVEAGRWEPLLGRLRFEREFTAEEKQHLQSGLPLLVTEARPGGQASAEGAGRVLLVRAVSPEDWSRGVIAGEASGSYLWGAEQLADWAELCVLTEAREALYCSEPMSSSFSRELAQGLGRSISGNFQWESESESYEATYWSVFLKSRFLAAPWTVVVSEARAMVLAPLRDFRTTFLLVVLASLWVVLLLSLVQIRRSLAPLERLQEGTRRIARREFGTRVEVTSGDEYQELADSFNAMAGRLGRQFNALTTMEEIDRAILAALNTERIVETALRQFGEVLGCEAVGVTLVDDRKSLQGSTFFRIGSGAGARQAEPCTVSAAEAAELRRERAGLVLAAEEKRPSYVRPLVSAGLGLFLAQPLFVEEALGGVLVFGYGRGTAPSEEDREQARQLAERVAVALSNAWLLQELDQFSWGTLTALARAIDAKSPWTAGHSERVTEMALRIGREMGLSEEELVIMQRGGLLHDIGKIGTPPGVLDKAGRLTVEEMSVMRDHVRQGARILEPIPGFQEILPIVLQHHEWWNGRGYPEGLKGEAIHLHARIFAVADCHDALASERPYRPGLPQEKVVQMIEEESGTHFDPRVVKAFLEVIRKGGRSETEKAAIGMAGSGGSSG